MIVRENGGGFAAVEGALAGAAVSTSLVTSALQRSLESAEIRRHEQRLEVMCACELTNTIESKNVVGFIFPPCRTTIVLKLKIH